MASRYFEEFDKQVANIRAAEQTSKNIQAYSAVDTQDVARRLNGYGKTAPWLSADAALALAHDGIEVNSPEFEQIQKAAGKAKVKKGFGWHSIGDFVTSTGRKSVGAISDAIGGVGSAAGHVVKPATRTFTDAASYLGQTVTGTVRTLHHNIDEYGFVGSLAAPFKYEDAGAGAVMKQTNLGQIAHTAARGEKVNTGSGFFTKGDVSARQAQASRDAWSVDGKAFTFGRGAATLLPVEPHTLPYNLMSGLIDATVAWHDPGAKAIGVASKARKASKEFNPNPADVISWKQGAGLIEGSRKDIMTDRVEAYLNSEKGAKIGHYIADSDFTALYKQFGKDIDADILTELADIKDPTEAMEALRPLLGIANGMTRELKTPGAKRMMENALGNVVFRNNPKATRLASMMPDVRGIDANDVSQATRQIDLHAKNALLPDSLKNQWVEKMARTTSPIDRFRVAQDFLGDVAVHLTTKELPEGDLNIGTKVVIPGGRKQGRVAGTATTDDAHKTYIEFENGKRELFNTEDLRLATDVSPDAARKLTRMFGEYNSAERRYWIDSITGENKAIPGVDKAGPTPHLYNEHIQSHIPMPSASDIRSATTKFGRLMDKSTEVKVSWKGGEQHRVLFVKEFNEVVKYGVNMWKASALLRGAYTVRVEGESQLRMAGAGWSTLINHPLDYFQIMRHQKAQYGITGGKFKDEDELARAADEYSAALTRRQDYKPGGKVAGVKDELFDRDNLDLRDQYVNAWADDIIQSYRDDLTHRIAGGGWKDGMPEGYDSFKSATWKESWDGSLKHIREDLAKVKGREHYGTDKGWGQYLDTIEKRLDDTVHSNPELVDVVATGLFNGKPITNGLKVSSEFKQFLSNLADEGFGPRYVAGQREIRSSGGHVMEHLDNTISHAFSAFAGMPANKFSRSPVFRQAYWERAEELLPFMDPKAQAATLEMARKSKLGKLGDDVIGRMKKSVDDGHGDLTLEEADHLAKTTGLKTVQDLLYDLSRKSQFFDAYQLAFPFGDAWLEVGKTWSKLALVDNPALIQRGHQAIEGARGADPDNDGQGFFYKDPTTGEEMFTVPFSRAINETILNQPIPFSSPVKGLNIFGTIMPGLGPVMQIPAGALIPDIPQADELQELFFPMGELDREAGGFVESFYPPWVKKLVQGVSGGEMDERQFNNTVMTIWGQLVDQGRFDFNDPHDVQEAFDEARTKARVLYGLQAVAQFGLPSPPTQDFLVHNQDGKLVLVDLLKNDLTAMGQDETAGGWKTAMQRFVDKYGTDSLLVVASKSEQVSGYVPVTKEGKNWARSQSEIAENFPEVYGLFAPSDGKFDVDEFSRQLRGGERKALTAKEVLQNTQATAGNLIYKRAKEKVGNRKDKAAQDYLAQIKEQIIKEYPGWGTQSFSANELATRISQLDEAMEHPTVANSDAGKGYAIYSQAREKALKSAEKLGLKSFSKSPKAQPIRDWLNAVAEAIQEEHPDFSNMWDRVLSKEASTNTSED